MKQFFGAFFGSILGIVFATIIAVLLIIAAVKTSFSSNDSEQQEEVVVVKDNSVLKLTVEGAIIDREKENPFKDLGDLGPLFPSNGYGLNTLITKINNAKTRALKKPERRYRRGF